MAVRGVLSVPRTWLLVAALVLLLGIGFAASAWLMVQALALLVELISQLAPAVCRDGGID